MQKLLPESGSLSVTLYYVQCLPSESLAVFCLNYTQQAKASCILCTYAYVCVCVYVHT